MAARAAEWGAALFEGVWGALWPARCPLCQEPLPAAGAAGFCLHCSETIKPINEPVCRVCGRALTGISDPPGQVCGFCEHRPPEFDLARSYGFYDGALGEAIRAFKFRGQRSLLSAMTGLMREAFEKQLMDVGLDAVVPVPLHAARLRERGFNQAVDLARPVARRGGLPLLHHALLRIRPTEPQYGLTLNQRRENVKGAFSITRHQLVKDKNLLVVDDILTTGATAIECARILKKAGAGKVMVLTLARTA